MKMRTLRNILLAATLLVSGAACSQVKDTTPSQIQSTAGVPLLRLNNGIDMPQFGIGTFGIPDNAIAADAVSFALKNGYRHIDTAHAYNDEKGVGDGLRQSGVPREQVWITSKLWPSDYTGTNPDEAIDNMLKRLGTDYIDLLYIHQPVGDVKAAYNAMIRAYKKGKIRALGISNFDYDDPRVKATLRWFVDSAEIRPQVMQIECHPYAQRLEMRKYLTEKGIQLECWFPLGGAMSNGALFRDPVIQRIAKAHGKTPAQVIIRWHLQEGFSVIPGATRHDYIKENISTMDFALSQAEMDDIRALNKERRFFNANYEQTLQFVGAQQLR
jgi:diketogulonate reductase-like aldo/keto reductase